MSSAAPSAAPRPARALARIEVVDWLRGLAVVLMVQWHAFDAWVQPAARVGPAYWLVRHMAGLPSRLFLLLVGVSAAIRFEGQLARGVPSAVMRRQLARRGLEIVALAYLFRLQEHILAGFYGGWAALFKVDVLNGIGASMLVVAAVAVPRDGRRQIAAALAAAAVFIGLGPVIGPAQFPSWLPRPLTSYLGGQRPMSWFPIFPWAGWALAGVAIGHLWVRESATPRRQARCFLLTGLAGLATTGAVILVRKIDPELIRYPSEFVQQMGPGSFFFRLGIIGALATVAWAVTRASGARFSVMQQLGKTSLLIYWVHLDICYGYLTRSIHKRLGMAEATAWTALLLAAMLALSYTKTRWAGTAVAWLRARLGRLRGGAAGA